MLSRSSRSKVTFSNPFTVGSSQELLPPGTYEVVVEEELLQGLSFEAYRRSATHLVVRGKGDRVGQTTMHSTTQEELDHAIACDQRRLETNQDSDAALSPLEDTT